MMECHSSNLTDHQWCIEKGICWVIFTSVCTDIRQEVFGIESDILDIAIIRTGSKKQFPTYPF